MKHTRTHTQKQKQLRMHDWNLILTNQKIKEAAEMTNLGGGGEGTF